MTLQLLKRPAKSLPECRLDANALVFLRHLRSVFMTCRPMAKTSLFEACALLHGNPDVAQQAFAEALMRCLGEALSKKVHLYAPGAKETTFDENWLVGLGLAWSRGDEASFDFLINSRVRPENRRLMRYLVSQVAEQFFGAQNAL